MIRRNKSFRTRPLAALATAVTALALMVLAPTPVSHAATSVAAPEPSPVPTRWELEFRSGPLRIAVIDTENGRQHFAYLTYRVTNYSGADRLFAPSFDLLNEKGLLIRSGQNVPPTVTDQIIAGLENPVLQSQLQIVDVLLQGRENAKFGVVIWPLEDLAIDEIRIFAGGFSGESTVYFTNDPETGERIRHVLRKTRQLQYDLPGELTVLDDDPIEATTERWIMR